MTASPLKKSVKKTVSSSKKKQTPITYRPLNYSIRKGRETSPKGNCYVKVSLEVPSSVSPAKKMKAY
jgi:hypothetical protein